MAKSSILIFLFCFLFACAPSMVVKRLADISESEILVFGEIVATNAKPGTRYDIFIQRDREDEIRVKIKKDRSFYWRLRPGSYTITSFRIAQGMGYGVGRIWVKFDVPVDCKAVYIGTLTFTISAISNIDIRDNIFAAESMLKERFPSHDFVVTKKLMRKEIQP